MTWLLRIGLPAATLALALWLLVRLDAESARAFEFAARESTAARAQLVALEKAHRARIIAQDAECALGVLRDQLTEYDRAWAAGSAPSPVTRLAYRRRLDRCYRSLDITYGIAERP